MEKAFQCDGGRTLPACLHRRTPFSPRGILLVETDPPDNLRQIGRQTAATLELSQYRAILDELEMYERPQLVGLLSVEATPSRNAS